MWVVDFAFKLGDPSNSFDGSLGVKTSDLLVNELDEAKVDSLIKSYEGSWSSSGLGFGCRDIQVDFESKKKALSFKESLEKMSKFYPFDYISLYKRSS